MDTLAAATVLLIVAPCAVLVVAALGIGSLCTLRGTLKLAAGALALVCTGVALILVLASLKLAEWGEP